MSPQPQSKNKIRNCTGRPGPIGIVPNPGSAIDGKTIAEVYHRRIQLSRDQICSYVKKGGEYRPLMWEQVHQQVIGLFKSYQSLGLKFGDKVCILSQSRPEWSMIDYANLTSGLVTVPIYQSSVVDDIAFIVEHSEAKLIFAEDKSQCNKLDLVFAKLNQQIPVICLSEDSTTKYNHFVPIPFSRFAKPETDKLWEEKHRSLADKIGPDTPASIVYTSGTTGQPKGVLLYQSSFCAETRGGIKKVGLTSDHIGLTFLPFAHVLGRLEVFVPLFSAMQSCFAENINTVAQNIAEVRPTVMISVPRIYEKIYAKILNDVASQSELKQNLFRWAVKIGREVVRLRSEKKSVPLALNLKFQVADQIVLSKIREKLGGRLKFTISGGAPLSAELCEFFHACGICILEGYGLTETAAAVLVNQPDDFCFGTVGSPLEGVEVKIAEDGEVLLRGPMVFKEYYKNPEATKEAFAPGGWFRTGDIGEINARGFLKITDRKKELIVTSAGKNIAPQKLENLLKGCRYVSQAMVFGDKKKYVIALITLNEPVIVAWAKANGIAKENYNELVRHTQVLELIDREIKAINGNLASYESIKRFKILPVDFTVETGELTPSLKLKRRVIIQKYTKEIDSLYT